MKWPYEEWTIVCDIYFHLNVWTCTYLISQTECIFVIIDETSQLEVVQWVPHGADLGDDMGNLLLNLLSLSLLLQLLYLPS